MVTDLEAGRQVLEPPAGKMVGNEPLLDRRPRGDVRQRRLKRILLVDDDPDIVRLLTMTLQPEGFRLLSASDGNAALDIARAERPDLLLLDWNMPGRDGLEVCRTLRAESDPGLCNVPVVLLTAQTGAEDTAAGFAAGVTDYVTKPFSPAHIRARVHAWLRRKRAGAEGT